MNLTASDLEAVSTSSSLNSPEENSMSEAKEALFDATKSDIPVPPSVIDGRYKVEECLGIGAMGSVYLVKHIRLRKRFALKMVNPKLASLPEFVTRFEREADACSRLNHPNCISVTDFGQTKDGTLYLVMEYADGLLLSDVLRDGPLTVTEAIEYTRQILQGLKHAHGEGLIHRDIKLENVVRCTNDDGRVELKILDFGMAKERPNAGADASITREGVVMGTPHYIAPEQVKHGQVDARADLYSVGVTLFRLVTGSAPFPGNKALDVLAAKLKKPAPSLDDVAGKSFHPELEAFVARALQRDPDERYQDAKEMLDGLEAVAVEVDSRSGVTGALLKGVDRLKLFFNGVRREVIEWYGCRESEEDASWGNRIKGLVTKRVGQVVLTRFLAALTVVVVLLIGLTRTSEEPPSTVDEQVAITASMTTQRPLEKKTPPQKNEKSIPKQIIVDDPEPAPDLETKQEAAAPKPLSPDLMKVALLVEQKKCGQAEERIIATGDQESPQALYLIGRIKMCLGRPEQALAFYHLAVEADPAYRADTRLLEDAKAMISNTSIRMDALDFMSELGEPALPALIQLAGRHLSKKVRHYAQGLVEKQGALSHVALEASLELDLNQSKSCSEKRTVVKKLGELGTPKARGVLARARDAQVKEGWFKKRYKHECVRNDILKALKKKKKK